MSALGITGATIHLEGGANGVNLNFTSGTLGWGAAPGSPGLVE